MKKIFVFLLLSTSVMAEDMDVSSVNFEYQPIIQPAERIIQINYTWDDFLQGKSCEDDFNRLDTSDFISQKQHLLKEKMQLYCLDQKRNTVWTNLLNLFRQSKKNLLVSKTLKENGQFWGYIKATPYFLFDIHNAHPNGNTLNGKLDLIQNAIQNKDPEGILIEMQKLLPTDQLYLNNVFSEASLLVDFKSSLKERNEL